ncbi:MAG TPA: ATP-binding protein [Armatimonadota bacterium]|nr:ATP-binding protein [Armatimonadota bacterium]
MFASIRVRLIAYHLIVLVALLSLLSVFLYTRLSRIVYGTVDAELLARAEALAASVEWNKAKRLDLPDAFMAEYSNPLSGSFFQLRDAGGRIIGKSASLGTLNLPWQARRGCVSYQTLLFHGKSLRMVTYPGHLEESAQNDKDSTVVLQCATAIRNEESLLHKFATLLTVAILAILAASALGCVLIARAVLKPIREITETIDRVTESNMSDRVATDGIAPELQGVAAAFNHTMDRLEGAFSRQREFTADASHELRTPLAVIISQGEIALRRPRAATEYAGVIASVLHTARLMSGIVEKLLTLARLPAEKSVLQFQRLEMGELIQDAVNLVAPLAANRQVTIHTALSEPGSIVGERAALVELFMNVLDNAVKYNHPGGTVTVQVAREDGQVSAVVRDTGIGIPDLDRERVFDRFYRVDKSRSRELGGAGLGLSICAEIVRVHGGTIGIASKLGQGTTVTISIPEAKSPQDNAEDILAPTNRL